MSEPGKHDDGVESHPRTVLLGLGNDILTDDAIGLRVAAAVREELREGEAVRVVLSSEMGLALLDEVVGFEQLVIVDAVETGQEPPGFVHEIDGNDLSALPLVSPHFLGVGEVLALGRKLGMSVPTWVAIFAVEVKDAKTVNTGMTPELEAALPHIADRVLEAVRALSAV